MYIKRLQGTWLYKTCTDAKFHAKTSKSQNSTNTPKSQLLCLTQHNMENNMSTSCFPFFRKEKHFLFALILSNEIMEKGAELKR